MLVNRRAVPKTPELFTDGLAQKLATTAALVLHLVLACLQVFRSQQVSS